MLIETNDLEFEKEHREGNILKEPMTADRIV